MTQRGRERERTKQLVRESDDQSKGTEIFASKSLVNPRMPNPFISPAHVVRVHSADRNKLLWRWYVRQMFGLQSSSHGMTIRLIPTCFGFDSHLVVWNNSGKKSKDNKIEG